MQIIIALLSSATENNVACKVVSALNHGTLTHSIAGMFVGSLSGAILDAHGSLELAGATGDAAGFDFGLVIGQF